MMAINKVLAETISEIAVEEQALGLAERANNLYAFSLGAGLLLALGIFIYAGVRYAASGGNSSSIGDAKKWMGAAAAGLLILFTSFIIIREINPSLLTLKDPATVRNESIAPTLGELRLLVPGTGLTCDQIVEARGGWVEQAGIFCSTRVRTGPRVSLTKGNIELYLNGICTAGASVDSDVDRLYEEAVKICGDAVVGGEAGGEDGSETYTINEQTLTPLCSVSEASGSRGTRAASGELFRINTLAGAFSLDRTIYQIESPEPIGGWIPTEEYAEGYTSIITYNLGKLLEYCANNNNAFCTLDGKPAGNMNQSAKDLVVKSCVDLLR